VSDRKPRRTTPQVEVIRRPAAGTPAPAPSTPAASAQPQRRGPPRRSGPPRPPPTAEQVLALARREHVPARIAKGDLEGKMKCRIWRKLHPEEAKRFDQVYELIGKHAELDFEDAFGVLQSGLSPREFLERKAKTQKKTQVRQARSSVPGDAIEAFVHRLIEQQSQLSVVLGERTITDVLRSVEPVAFTFDRSGRIEKLQIVLIGIQQTWEKISPSLDRDPELSQKPMAVVRQPERRPVSDPRPFLPHAGKKLKISLRNGLTLTERVRAAGPFDLLLGEENQELFLPLHAIVKWEAIASA